MHEERPVTMSESERQMRRRMALIGIAVAIIVVLILLSFAGMIALGITSTVMQVVIIQLAAESLIVGGVTLFLLYQVIMLVTLIREEVIPLIQSAQETVSSARGTTVYVGRKIVVPSVRVASNMARLQAMARVLFRGK